ncbi:GNAT family N-acetyltransferase [Chitinivorax sp. B]|uniref:GNAT family N-acetyltransferase n=1 Tax=Chitinivorax sp. B TaxID=2502235 RepID=UPI0010F81C1D|nr:GNAT family N-acetyltransferase [Chitinivorax sp. B]
MNIIARKAETKDLDGILVLYRELRPHDPELAPTVAEDIFANLLSQGYVHVLVCEAEGILVATCTLVTIPNLASGARPYGVIEHVVTLSAHRGKGYARIVLDQALSLAWSLGCYKVMLLSGAQRIEAHKLYESVGFNGDIERGFVAKPTGTASPFGQR